MCLVQFTIADVEEWDKDEKSQLLQELTGILCIFPCIHIVIMICQLA